MTEQVTALIADDEAPARQLLAEYLARFPQVRVVAVCADGAQAVREIDLHRPSLAFLDIHMPAPTGLEVLTRVRHLPRVVFTTAHPEFAVQAFEVNAVDYLLKPYDFERFAAAVDKALKASRGLELDRLVSLLHDVRRRETPGQLFLKLSGRIVAVARRPGHAGSRPRATTPASTPGAGPTSSARVWAAWKRGSTPADSCASTGPPSSPSRPSGS